MGEVFKKNITQREGGGAGFKRKDITERGCGGGRWGSFSKVKA